MRKSKTSKSAQTTARQHDTYAYLMSFMQKNQGEHQQSLVALRGRSYTQKRVCSWWAQHGNSERLVQNTQLPPICSRITGNNSINESGCSDSNAWWSIWPKRTPNTAWFPRNCITLS